METTIKLINEYPGSKFICNRIRLIKYYQKHTGDLYQSIVTFLLGYKTTEMRINSFVDVNLYELTSIYKNSTEKSKFRLWNVTVYVTEDKITFKLPRSKPFFLSKEEFEYLIKDIKTINLLLGEKE